MSESLVSPGLDHQADLPVGAARAAEPVRHRARGDRSRRRLVGRRSVQRQSRLGEAPGVPARRACRPRSRRSSTARSTSSAACSTTGRSTGSCATCRPRCGTFSSAHKFFAMIIPKNYGGLGFSAYAHSEVIRKLSTRSLCGAVTAMVPNSLGPGELLHAVRHQGAAGLLAAAARRRRRRFPASGSPARRPARMPPRWSIPAWSAAARWQGREVLGIRLNWHKRYITLGPIATVLGLAFKLYDPDHLIGDRDEIGITVALVPTNLPGVEIGRRHLPVAARLPERPELGPRRVHPDGPRHRRRRAGRQGLEDADERARRRARHLAAVAVGGGCAFAAHTTGAYARIREQFHVPIGRFEAIQERLGRMAATAYLLDAARRLTCAGIDHGHKPAVVTAIMKSQATERHARGRQRRHGHPRRQGRAGRPAQLSRQPLSRRCRSASRSRAPTSSPAPSSSSGRARSAAIPICSRR